MAQKRMFDKAITNSDDFLELPDSSQVLYFHLSMNADDDGFVNNWKSILKMTGTKEDDLKILIAKSFIIPFESGVIVIKHWRINNFLRKDRHIETKYKQELNMLFCDTNNEYILKDSNINEYLLKDINPLVNQGLTQNSIEENSIEKNIYIVEQKSEKKDNSRLLDYVKEIIDYLNQETNSHYKNSTKATISKIKARLDEGFTLEDFKYVIKNKAREWIGTEYEKYLSPDTLFSTKFEKYLNQKNFDKREKPMTQQEKNAAYIKKMKEELGDE